MAESTKSAERDEKMRVKLYMLNAGRAWDDQGTGYVSSTFAEKTKNMYLIVKEENKSESFFHYNDNFINFNYLILIIFNCNIFTISLINYY